MEHERKLLEKFNNVYSKIGDEIVVLESDDTYYYGIPSYTKLIKIPKKETFNTKMDAMYYKFLNADAPVSNYKKSKYYQYYVNRAHKENPERLI